MSDPTLDSLRRKLQPVGQEHLLAFWNELDEASRRDLADDIDALDLRMIARLVPELVLRRPVVAARGALEPPSLYPQEPGPDLSGLYTEARRTGQSLLAAGKVAALTVAGGGGTRLGFDGPKGAFPISPVKHKPLFRLFAEFLLAAARRYGGRLRWYIMTSPANDADTRAFFERHRHFGYSPDDITFFRQGVMPVFSPEGKILLVDKHRVALSPDGHGGTLLALARSGALADMAACGIELISYFQVDNPLVRAVDPLFIGLHALTGSEMSSKGLAKVDERERVGNFVNLAGRLSVIEYSDLPEALARARDPDGSLRFSAGNPAIHVLSRSFVERLTADADALSLPWHRADKKVAHLDVRTARAIEPDSPNAVKLETFIFDAIPLAEQAIVLMIDRQEEFSPVKNARGADSPESARRDLVRRAAGWLEAAGCRIPRRADGEPDCLLEISPLAALDADHLRQRAGELSIPPSVSAGHTLYLG